MRQLKDIHPDYADRVDLLAVDVDSTESAQKILSYKEDQGFVWPMATADRDMLVSYNVTQQAAHVAVDADGTIASSVDYGGKSDAGWREVFESLLDS